MLTWLLVIMLVATAILLVAQISVRVSTEHEAERLHDEVMRLEREKRRLESLVWGMEDDGK